MDSYWLNLLTAGIGVLVSPLAVIAIVAILLSHRPGINGAAFLAGWTVAITAGLAVGLAITAAVVDDAPADAPTWVSWVRVAIGSVLIAGGVFSHLRGRHHLRLMASATKPADVVEAAPQLPGWLRAVETFTPFRSWLLGFALCVLNPVDLSFIMLAAITLSSATPTEGSAIVGVVLFVLISAASVAAPVIYYATHRAGADRTLGAMRTWIVQHTAILNTAVLVGFGVMQLVKGLRSL